MRMNSIASVIGASLALASFGQTSQAAVISFDPDGAGPDPAVQVGSFDLLPGNLLNKGVLAGGATFTNLVQARLGALLDTNGNVIPVPGLNTTFQITVVAQFDLTTTGLFGVGGPVSTSTTTLAAVQPVNFVKFYQNNALTANDLTGTGFTDGTRILQGSVSFAASSFSQFDFQNPVLFDNFGTDDWAGQMSKTGIGGATINADSLVTDPAYFITPPAVLSLNSSTTNAEPFSQINPSHKFFDGTIPAIGATNGQSGPDIQLQSDSVASFAVPEPASLALLGLSALGMCMRQRRRPA